MTAQTPVGEPLLDLVVLVADADQHELFRALLETRGRELGLRALSFEILKHPQRDPGCFHGAPDVLRVYTRTTRHALVALDREGSGRDKHTAQAIGGNVEERLAANGWGDRAAAVVLDPEIEAWIWSGAPQLPGLLGWPDGGGSLWNWLDDTGRWPRAHAKPARPKETLLATLRHTGRRHSAALYGELAQRVDFRSCKDEAFGKLKLTLRQWFGSDDSRDPGTPT